MKQRKRFIVTAVAVMGLLVTSTFSAGAGLELPFLGERSTDGATGPIIPGLNGTGGLYVEGEVLVKYHNGSIAAEKRNFRAANQLILKEVLPSSEIELLQIPKGLTVAQAVEKLKKDPRAEFVQPNFKYYPTETDTYYHLLWGLNNTGQSINYVPGTDDVDIDGLEAWAISADDAPRVIVAVIDTGVDISHPDLLGQIWVNQDEIPNNRKDYDRNGYIDDVNGWNFYSDTNKLLISAKEDGHGTHVAGTIAARIGNGIGVAGVAERVQIMPLKFIGPQYGDTADAIRAIEYAKANGAVIANNSWGGGGEDLLLYKAINTFGYPFIVAAGNDGLNNDQTPSYPSSYSCSNIIAVAAVDNTGALASWSNYGATQVDVAAPGVDIASCYPGNTYYYMGGTSMAAPHVSGIAALILGNHPGLTAEQVKGAIMNSVQKMGSLDGKVASGGLVNAYDALKLAIGADTPPPPPPADTTAPAMLSIDPNNNATGVKLNQSVFVTYDEPIVLGSGKISFVDNKNRGVKFKASVNGNTLVIDPVNNLLPTKTYKVTIQIGAVIDVASNINTVVYSTTFTTGSN